jgi:hypothetical protein
MGVCRVPPGPVAQHVRFAAQEHDVAARSSHGPKGGTAWAHDLEMQAAPAGPDTDGCCASFALLAGPPASGIARYMRILL